MFEEKIMNGSGVIAKIAGPESVVKTISVDSTAISTIRRGDCGRIDRYRLHDGFRSGDFRNHARSIHYFLLKHFGFDWDPLAIFRRRRFDSFRRLLVIETMIDHADKPVREVMRPRSSVAVIRLNSPWNENARLLRETRFSRYPIVEADGARPLGILHVMDLALAETGQELDAAQLKELARSGLELREDLSLAETAAQFRRHSNEMGIILNVAYFGIRKFDTGGRLPERQARTEAELAARFAADMKDAADENRADIAHQVQALYARQQRDPNATLDFLLLSGGGDRSAFGAGFLLGWASVEGG